MKPLLALLVGCCIGAVACSSGGNDEHKRASKVYDARLPVRVHVNDAAAKKGPRAAVLRKAPPVPPAPRGLPETPSPKYNPTTANKVMLGKLLFFDKRLSGKTTRSCGSCHIPEHGWADHKVRSATATGALNLRHTPSLYNVGYYKSLRWDGAMTTLEAFVLNHWRGQLAAVPRAIVARLHRIPEYRAHFSRSFGGRVISADRVVEALSAFLRTIRSGDSPWDIYELNNDESAVSKATIAGSKLFRDTAQCGLCHPPPHYMDNLFHNIGIGFATQSPDKGRAMVTENAADTGAFRTPTLRGIGDTAPYFHDGSASSVKDAVGYSLSGGFHTDNPWIDPKLKRISLSAKQVDELVAFLRALTPAQKPFVRPVLPRDPGGPAK